MTRLGTLAMMCWALVLPACGSGPGTSTGGSGGAGASSGGATGQGGSSATGGRGGASGTGGAAGASGTAGHGGAGSGGRGGAGGSNVVDAGIPADAKSCTPVNANFDCPEHLACDSQLHYCTNRCSATQPCHGGCCKNGLCQSGLDDGACGQDGTACISCNALEPGPKCEMATTVDSPTRPGGYCGCASATDCTATGSRTQCQSAASQKRCCAPTNATCATATDCCGGVCAIGTCG
jgi:hypothetical protein